MAGSLQDQLKNSGLVSKKKSQQLDAEKRKKIKAQNKGQKIDNEISEKVKQAELQKKYDDQKRNQQQQLQVRQNEEKARINQIVDQAKIKDYDGDTAFNFQFNNKVKTLYLNKENYDALVAGSIGLCQIDNAIFILPNSTVNKINKINPIYVVLHQEKLNTMPETAPDDPYADYDIPDDLMW
jgi:uncharacterized protein YaiL (DUF2058 family)